MISWESSEVKTLAPAEPDINSPVRSAR